MNHLIYDTATGQVIQGGTCEDSMWPDLPHLKAGQAAIAYFDWRDAGNLYVDLGPPPEVKKRTAMPASLDKATIAADGADTATISGIPTGTLVLGFGQHITVDDGTLAITTDLAGEHVIRLMHPRHHDLILKVMAE